MALGRGEPAREGLSLEEEIIIDPDTGMMIGERTIATAQLGEFPTGTISSSTSIETTVVNDAP